MINKTSMEWILRVVGVCEVFASGVNLISFGSIGLSLLILTMGILCIVSAERIAKHG
tara:strand:- start:390 stop:560 length:171 start_codon:yes stop_codon:yes gene_type:complete